MKQIYATLFFCLFTSLAFAQKDFRAGYIIQNGDTLRGYVDYRGAIRNAKTTAFKATPEASEQAFSPDQLTGYGFDKEQKIYEAKTVPATEAQPAQRLFLQALAKGRASLYTYRDETDQDRFFLLKEGGDLVELTQTVYNRKDPQSGKIFRFVEQSYLSMLASAFYDCSNLSEQQISSVKLQANSLSRLVSRYNTCMDEVQYTQQPRKTTLSVYPLVSYSLSSLHMSGSHLYASGGSYGNKGTGLGAGIAAEINNPNVSEKLSLVLELFYAPYRFEGEVSNDSHIGRSTRYDLLFDLDYVKLPAQLRYTFPKGKIRPFANAGASFAYAIKTERVETRRSSFHNSEYSDSSVALEGNSFRNYMFGVLGGAGMLYPLGENALLLEARFETTQGISTLLSLGSSVRSVSLLVGYRF